MTVRATWLWFGGLVLGAAGLVAACGSSGGTAANGGCTPGASVACTCPGGAPGAQICASDGKSLGTCQCGSGSGGSTTTTTGATCQCTNPAGENFCGSISADGGTGGSSTTTTTATTTTTKDGGASAGKLTYAGKLTTQFGSNWAYKVAVGIAAGNEACTDMAADHVCDYDDLVFAASKGELSTLATTETAWLERTASVTVSATSPKIVVLGQPATVGKVYTVGPASRCNDWNYSTDHLNDGEYVDFSTGTSTPTFHFDDNPSAIQATPKDIPCGHNTMNRDVLCCYPKCM